MISQCLISFGSNLGDRESVIADAARRVASQPGIGDLRTSRLYRTPPIGGPGGQEPFLNAVAAFDTTCSAREILAILQDAESFLGRQRRARWGARSIDLDVVLHGALVGGSHGLIVPHPRYTARLFVLRPACDVAAHYRDPRFGWTIRELARHVTAAAPSLALIGDTAAARQELCERLTAEFGVRTIPALPMSPPMEIVGNAPAASRMPPPPRTPPAYEPSRDVAASNAPETGDTGVGDTGVGDAGVGDAGAARRSLGEGGDVRQNAPGASSPWVAAAVPPLPSLSDPDASRPGVPRLLARLQRTTPETRWPAPHQIWPGGWSWPEYRLEIDEPDWAVSELASALDSMRCPTDPVTESGDWWHP